jgi:hypothetical protein
MICSKLTVIAPMRDLITGANMDDPTRATASAHDLDFFRLGKETCIEDMMDGGTGWPVHIETLTAFDDGCSIERYDRASYLRWFANPHSCIQDRQNGKVN